MAALFLSVLYIWVLRKVFFVENFSFKKKSSTVLILLGFWQCSITRSYNAHALIHLSQQSWKSFLFHNAFPNSQGKNTFILSHFIYASQTFHPVFWESESQVWLFIYTTNLIFSLPWNYCYLGLGHYFQQESMLRRFKLSSSTSPPGVTIKSVIHILTMSPRDKIVSLTSSQSVN